jgi:curli biogenesis system outer membrane secretion channel CsgG
MFKKVLFIALSALTLAQFPLLSQRASAQGERETIFIGPIKVQDAITESAKRAGRTSELAQIQQALRGQLVTELNQTRVFQIVERERKDDIELEQAFAEVAVNPNDKNRAQSLRMAGAKYAFLPQIDGFEDRRSTVRYDAISRSSHSRSVWISATVSIVDTTTGALLPESPSVRVKSSSSAEYVRGGAALGGDELISGLTRELAEKLARESVTLMRPAKVLTTSPRILINRGSEADFNICASVEFY